jgi:hypothetical protein
VLVLLVGLGASTLGCGDDADVAPGKVSGCAGLGRVTVANDTLGDVHPNIRAPAPPPPPAGIDLVEVRLAQRSHTLCAVFTTEAPPPAAAAYRIGLREKGEGDSGAAIGIQAVPGDGERYVQLEYPTSDERPDGGRVKATIGVRGKRVSLRMDTGTFPDWAPLGDFEWEASSLGIGNRRGLQYTDCAPESTQHIAYPSGRLVSFENSRFC